MARHRKGDDEGEKTKKEKEKPPLPPGFTPLRRGSSSTGRSDTQDLSEDEEKRLLGGDGKDER